MRFVERIVDHFTQSQLCLYFLDSFGLMSFRIIQRMINTFYILNYVAFRSLIFYIAETIECYWSIPQVFNDRSHENYTVVKNTCIYIHIIYIYYTVEKFAYITLWYVRVMMNFKLAICSMLILVNLRISICLKFNTNLSLKFIFHRILIPAYIARSWALPKSM